jgi:hypothetical protein
MEISKGGVNIKGLKLTVAFAMLLALMVCIPTGMAASEDDIQVSIENGVVWLAENQQVDGSWDGGFPDADIGATGLVLLKFIEYANEQDLYPTDPEYEYSDNVIAGLEFLDSHLVTVPVDGGYDGNLNENMTYLDGFHRTYVTSIATMAYSANPNTDPDLIQDLTDWLVNAQCTDDTSDFYGVWEYTGFVCFGDNSNTGYAALGLGYALNAGASIPDSTFTALNSYVDFIQNDPGVADDGSEDDPDGGSGYVYPDLWVNSLKTGNLIFEATLVGDSPDSSRILNATDYIYRHWNDDVEGWMGNDSAIVPYNTQYQATYAIMKGFEAIGLEELDGIDWFDEISTEIVDDQLLDGNWTNGPAFMWPDGSPVIATDELCTAWALLTLEKITVDRTPPEVCCVETVNPHGKNIPPAGSTTLPGAKGGQNEDGFYELIAVDNIDPEPEIFVVDSVTGVTFGPFESGTIIKYTEANGATPSIKEMGSDKGQAGAVDWHIKGQGDMILMAIDDSGNIAECTCCLVPPKPK